ncbi:hypothetical protein [Mycolicibacterium sp. P1-5]|uniref:hypothetical protein n=1 Tax=Mycolicibacterium sp. P1-5 TaxID=2024617 RepID=UPI0011ECD970|nr:hypothetical protein [Mycolicibacterium sp. P1-5]KAA0108053.1 hypothetical protein CIW47_15270 [Mycolicibacterium sp. P1-5]
MTNFYVTGSINVPTVEDAFRVVGTRLQPGVSRVPDGEPGDRANWVFTQAGHFQKNPTLDVVGDRVKARPGVLVEFGPVDYHSIATDSYAKFRRARDEGVLAVDSRFLVSIPTPFNAANSFVDFADRVQVAYAYEKALRRSVEAIQDAIPPTDLALQWDLPTELATFEGWFDNPYDSLEPILAATGRVGDWVRPEAQLTFHLCYGDSKFGASPFMGEPPNDEAATRGGRHVLPRDASAIVALANGLSRHVSRRIDAIHAATVAAWTKRAHWRPLADLALEPGTEFYLGLLHAEDGAEGATSRAELAAEFLPEFGISTECGLGRHSPEQLEAVLVAWRHYSTAARQPALVS